MLERLRSMLEGKARALIEIANYANAAKWCSLAIALLTLGFIVYEVAKILRAELDDLNKAKETRIDTWRQRIAIYYLSVCAAGELCHHIALVLEAYRA